MKCRRVTETSAQVADLCKQLPRKDLVILQT